MEQDGALLWKKKGVLVTFSSISGPILDHGSFRKKTSPWTILSSDFDLSL